MKSVIEKSLLAALVCVGSLQLGCSDGNGSTTGDDEMDSGTDGSSDDAGAGDADTDIDTDTDTDTGQSEVPPENLPARCKLEIEKSSVSEKNDWRAEGKGNGRAPDIAFEETSLMVWEYKSSEPDAGWEIQAAAYNPPVDGEGTDGGVDAPDAGSPFVGDVQNPASRGPVAQDPAVAARGGEFGIVWRDGRWDPLCTASDVAECSNQLAYLRVDSSGQPIDNPEPVQVTLDAEVYRRPEIAATADRYIIAWIEESGDAPALMAISVDENGNPGSSTPHLISTEDGIYSQATPAMAVLGDAAVIVWNTPNQLEILARRLNGLAEPQGDAQVVAEGDICLAPRIAAGDGGFMVSWSMQEYSDLEAYARKIDANGAPIGDQHRLTWTPSDVMSSAIAWSGSEYAVAWLSPKANGASECVNESCYAQVFATLLDSDGAIGAEPVLLSDDPNMTSNLSLTWDGGGFTAIYELPRFQRRQVFFSRMTCD